VVILAHAYLFVVETLPDVRTVALFGFGIKHGSFPFM
jgi:hypothetical protein